MSWCCGAMMVGSIGRLRRNGIVFDRVPLVYCPVCRRFDVHPLVADAFDLLLDYAEADGARVVDVAELLRYDEAALRAAQPFWDDGDAEALVEGLIDQALDLLSAARALDDRLWRRELHDRLRRLLELRVRIQAENRQADG
ncbi:hypothetical protein [Hydrogenibacillus sp. N12]|uniref:hypothetical protein n=1 Tax=Hydrogenibacillus sp. N12 TaxID=2866627 RepID=UPI001C7D38E8|nr:hypothetical protein [Hydrogenibacillus sp. N12]QZA32735.1 hypothetical protein K2M58_10805 [Hydrogenibacillus sp. N12]